MINVITVHWQTPKWIEPQLSYLERNLAGDFRVFAALNGIDDPEHRSRFYFGVDLEGDHPEKLNALAKTAIERSDPADILMFIDGDAFPVQSLDAWMDEALRSYPLAAVRRDENFGDPQPHPCFCVTTVGFWREIGGDWGNGPGWVNNLGRKIRDPGGILYYRLQELNHEWLPLVRTNTDNPDPLWFAVYGHLIYHHGAGFRKRFSRFDQARQTESAKAGVAKTTEPTVGSLRLAVQDDPSQLARIRPRHLLVAVRALQNAILRRQRERSLSKKAEHDERVAVAQAEKIFAQLTVDPDFYLALDSGARDGSSDSTP
ncbi:MAG TPA: hypothetical protein VIJ09_00525 [Acidimicrobiales bacterium]|jgi:hypothetical protein